MGGCLTDDFQKQAYPSGYARVLPTGAPSNLIASRLGAMRAMHAKGVTKVKIPTRKEQSKLDYLKAEMRGEELKVNPQPSAAEPSPQKGSYFSRFLPNLPKLPSLRQSPKPNSKTKKGESP